MKAFRNSRTSKDVSASLVSVQVCKGPETGHAKRKIIPCSLDQDGHSAYPIDHRELDDVEDDEIELKAFDPKISEYTITLNFVDPGVEREYLKKCKIKASIDMFEVKPILIRVCRPLQVMHPLLFSMALFGCFPGVMLRMPFGPELPKSGGLFC